MRISELLAALDACPLVASVQASPESPLDDNETLLRLARASIGQGVRVLRLESAARVKAIRDATGCAVIGLIKRSYPGSEVYITPTSEEADALVDAGCEVIALDGTPRGRPGGVKLEALIARIHAAGRLAMADCDSLESARTAAAAGADLVGTTLAGYTAARPTQEGPDLDLLRAICASDLGIPVLAEGRYAERWQVEAALRIGAEGVVVGGALNDAVKTTRALLPRSTPGPVGAVDIGGTWIRFAKFSRDWKLLESERAELPHDPTDRLDWIRSRLADSGAVAVGISSGGVVDSASGEVVSAKASIPGHARTRFRFDVPTLALNDGLATAWGHACLPECAGRRVATLALGTGVGCGLVSSGRIEMGDHGEYPRLNDLQFEDATIEGVLGGSVLTPQATFDQRRRAISALRLCVQILRDVQFAEVIYVCGGVGLAEWLQDEVNWLGLAPSPFGEDAGLYGAAALALFPPEFD